MRYFQPYNIITPKFGGASAPPSTYLSTALGVHLSYKYCNFFTCRHTWTRYTECYRKHTFKETVWMTSVITCTNTLETMLTVVKLGYFVLLG